MMWNEILYLFISLAYIVSAYPSHNYDVMRDECVERTLRDFKSMKKDTKITVNGRVLGFYGFQNSASAVILLDVSNTLIQPFTMNVSFTNLIMLHASYNGLEKIDNIGNDTFPSLKLLNLSHNALSSLKSHIYTHLSEIEVLDLSHNCFVHFNYDHAFLKHEHLKKLYLHDNLLHSFHSAHRTNLFINFEVLDLSRNSIQEFSDRHLKCRELIINNNELKELVIHHADSMRVNASNNCLISFSGEGSFDSLDLSYNSFEYLSNVDLKTSKFLNLTHNKIQSWAIESETSDSSGDDIDLYSRNTQIIDLSYNNLKHIKELMYFDKSTFINLEGNQLKDIDFEELREDFPYLQRINFINNPLSEVDKSELKFHNDTRFLNIHFEYEARDVAMTTLFPTLPTLVASTTENVEYLFTKIVEEKPTEASAERILHPDSQYLIWFFGNVIMGFLVLAIGCFVYTKYNGKSNRSRFMIREFNEAENPL